MVAGHQAADRAVWQSVRPAIGPRKPVDWGDYVQLAENINSFFHSVSSGLQPLNVNCLSALSDTDTVPDELVIEPYVVERLLRRINVRKSP